MSDDLVKRLRWKAGAYAKEAADRIEELEAKLATCEKYRDAYAECDRIGTQKVRELEAKLKTSEEIGRAFEEDAGQLRAKLAKAVETLKRYGGVMPIAFTPIQDGGYKARTTLAELTGGKDE